MIRALIVAISVTGMLPAWAAGQAPQFRWQSGQVLTYRVAQITTASETVGEKKSETKTRLDLVKKWKVQAVDAAGVATLSMSLERLRMETKTPAGESLLFDSADPAKSTPAMREEMSKYVGPAVVSVRIDGRGNLVEVKESKFGPASRLAADLPFKIILPATPFAEGLNWDRKYSIKIESAQGAAENYDAVQKLTCKSTNGKVAVVGLTTQVVNIPDSPADQIPLLPLLPNGEATFDIASGRLIGMKCTVAKEITGHQGEESKYVFTSSYVEELAP